MSCRFRVGWLPRLAVFVAAALVPVVLVASDRIKGVGRFNPEDETVQIFSAIEQGQLEVQLIAKNSAQCRVLITNKSDKPLNVALPEAFAGVPVLAQFNFPNFPDNNANNNNAPQNLGVGNQQGNFGNNQGNQPFFNMGNQGNNNRGNNFFAPFNIAPEKVAQLKLAAVCLEHGKPDPRPTIRYQMRPIESVTDKAEVRALCGMLGRGEVSQRAAQAAAWHLNNGMSWEQLQAKRAEIVFGRLRAPFFTRQELAEGKKAAEKAGEMAKQPKQTGKQDSLSLR